MLDEIASKKGEKGEAGDQYRKRKKDTEWSKASSKHE